MPAPSRCRAFRGETITEGLDGLAGRLKDYYELGARFAKWRAVIDIADGIPTRGAILANAEALARYAALCQEANIVPIVEPEVLMDGDHSLQRCYEVSEAVLRAVFTALYEQRVFLEGIVLEAQYGRAGEEIRPAGEPGGGRCGDRSGCSRTACRSRCRASPSFPAASRISRPPPISTPSCAPSPPWPMTFSYGRALQAAPQKAWSGKPANVAAAQAAFTHRAHMNSLAALGQWSESLEKAAA